MPAPQYTTQSEQTNVDERKLTKSKCWKIKFYFITTAQITNTDVSNVHKFCYV